MRAADVIPDGTTATTVGVGAGGKTQVNLAPGVNSGISHNKYTLFNVPRAGVDLNNQTVGAATILNEVTSSNPSLIQGPITVLGPQAHVILANPNGITVDGGSFVNTGGVVLSTGLVSFQDRSPTPAITQRNVVLTNGQPGESSIVIGAGGLSGTITFLELLSRQIQVNGAITNTNLSPNATIKLVAGKSITEYDSSISPANDTKPWSVSKPNGGVSPNTIAVDITRPASLSASKIQIAVTDQGAGVRHAGSILASAGDFILTANGDVQIHGGTISAQHDLIIARGNPSAGASPLTFHGDKGGGSFFSLKAQGALDLLADEINAGEGQFSTESDDVALGRKGVAALGALQLTGTPGNAFVNSGAGLGLYAEGQNMLIQGVDVSALNLAEIHSQDFTYSGVGGNGAWTPDTFTVGQGLLTATGSVKILGSDFLAGTDLKISGTDFSALAQKQGGSWRKSQVTALNGGLVIKTSTGGLTNDSSILQGNTRIDGDPDSLGGVTLNLAGKLLNYTEDKNNLAIIFAKGDDLNIQAPGDITNNTGRLLANGGVTIHTTGNLVNQIDHTDAPQQGQVEDYTYAHSGFLFFKWKVHGLRVNFGDLRIGGELAYIIAGKGLQINAANLSNIGGEIDANGGDLTIETGTLTNQGIGSGEARVEHSSLLFLRRNKIVSSYAVSGGNFSSSAQLNITATGPLTNQGGRFLALQDLNITSPAISGTGITGYQAGLTGRGIRDLFNGQQIQFLATEAGGDFISTGGTVNFQTQAPVTVTGGTVQGAAGVQATHGITVTPPLATPSTTPSTDKKPFGFLNFLFGN